MTKIRIIYKYLFHDKTHASWFITAACLGFVSGVMASIYLFTNPFDNQIVIIMFALLLVLIVVSRVRFMIVLALFAGVVLGLWRGCVDRVDIANYNPWINQNVVVEGTIESDPEIEPNGVAKIKLKDSRAILLEDYENLGDNDKASEYYSLKLPGKIWVSTKISGQTLRRSDLVQISGKLKVGFGSFPASMSYASLLSVAESSAADPMRELRDDFGESLRSVVDEPAASLGMGILAGQKSALPSEVSEAFIVASLTHIVVASGYNLTILVRSARRLFARISRFAALSLGGILMLSFAFVAGFSPSMNRAILVAALSLLAWYYGRRFHPVTLLSMAAAITVAMDPSNVWGNLGWYLSFLSFIGVVILAPLVRDYFFGDRNNSEEKPTWKSSLRQIFIETISAQIMAAPIIALAMGQFSVYGLIANLLVLPILPLAMLLTFMAGVASLILPQPVAAFVSQPAEWILNYIVGVANYISNMPNSSERINLSISACIGIFVAIFALAIYMKFKTKHNFRGDSVIE